MNQFSADDERRGRARMLAAIRAEQVKDMPEPKHERWCVEEQVMCDPTIYRHWCCAYHQAHDDDQEPA